MDFTTFVRQDLWHKGFDKKLERCRNPRMSILGPPHDIKNDFAIQIMQLQIYFGQHTVDGQNPAPVGRWLSHYLQGLSIPGGAGFLPSTIYQL